MVGSPVGPGFQPDRAGRTRPDRGADVLHRNPITQTGAGKIRVAETGAKKQLPRRMLRNNAQAKAVPPRETLTPDSRVRKVLFRTSCRRI